jgi:hypothetical protein
MADREPLSRHAATQRGALTVAQLDQLGITDRQRRKARSSGYLTKTGIHTYRGGLAVASLEEELAHLVLDCGPQAWASGVTAASLHMFDTFLLRRPFEATVRRGRNIRRAGHNIRTTTSMPLIDRTTMRGIPVTAAPRTIIDLARTCSVAQLTVAIDSMIRDGSGSEALLYKRIIALKAKGRPGLNKVIAALEGADSQRGGHSYLEREYLLLIAAAGLPRPDTQKVLSRTNGKIIRVDFRFPGTPVVVEVLGYKWHRTERQLEHDTRRMNQLRGDGFNAREFTYRQVVTEPGYVVSETAAALAQSKAA